MILYSDYLDKLGNLISNVECNGLIMAEHNSVFALVAAAALDNCNNQLDKPQEAISAQDVVAGMQAAVNLVENCGFHGNKLIWIGNGGSAAIASHSAIDYWKNGGIKSIDFNQGPLLTCIGNDYGYPAVFQKPIEMFAEQDDILMAISSSGQSENILNGVKAAKAKGCNVITFSGFSADNPLRFMGDLNFYVPSSHYGHVELVHQILCHSFLDLLIAKKNGEKTW